MSRLLTGYKTSSGNIVSPEARFSFPNVFRPGKVMEAGKEPKYSIVLLFAANSDLSLLKAAAEEVAVEAFGADKAKWPKNLRSPFRDQGEKAINGYVDGCKFITATSKQRPGLVDHSNLDIVEEHLFYAGCYGVASLRAFAYGGGKTGVTPGVAFGLQNIQKLRDGESLSGRSDPSKDFEPAAETAGATAGGIFD